MAIDTVEIVANPCRPVRPQSIPDDQERLLEMCSVRLEKVDDLFFANAALVETEQTIQSGKARNDRQLLPVEVKLNDGRLSLGRPRAYPRWPFAESRFVDKDDQAAFPAGFFLSAGHVLRLKRATAASSRSMARRSGF